MKLLGRQKTAKPHVSVSRSSGARDVPQFEQVLITRVIETTDIRTPIKRRITEDFFVLPETRAAFSYLRGHYQEYGTTPSVELFKEKFPDFEFHTTSDSVAAVCDHLRHNKLYRDLAEMTEEGVRMLVDDPGTALDHFRTMVASLTTGPPISLTPRKRLRSVTTS